VNAISISISATDDFAIMGRDTGNAESD